MGLMVSDIPDKGVFESFLKNLAESNKNKRNKCVFEIFLKKNLAESKKKEYR